jgi:hypothetical protein
MGLGEHFGAHLILGVEIFMRGKKDTQDCANHLGGRLQRSSSLPLVWIHGDIATSSTLILWNWEAGYRVHDAPEIDQTVREANASIFLFLTVVSP